MRCRHAIEIEGPACLCALPASTHACMLSPCCKLPQIGILLYVAVDIAT